MTAAKFNVRIPLLAMNRHQCAKALPVELMSMVFDGLSIEELIITSLVCTFWRAVAVRHQTYWRDIRLASLSTSALDFFEARLKAGSTRTTCVRVDIPVVESPARLRSVVLPALSRNLHRIDKLYLETDIVFDADLFSALQHPAPRLDTLDVVLCHETQSSGALPVNLFDCQAPNLRTVRILNAQLFADRLPHAFSPITDLSYCFNQAQSFPTALFAHCQHLQSLTIYGRYCSLSPEDHLESTIDARHLSSIDISVFAGSFDFVRCMPCVNISRITVTINDEQSAQLLLEHLRGPLEVELYRTPHNVYVRYTSRDTGMQRAFVCLPDQPAVAYLPPVYTSSALVSRVHTIRSSGSCAPLLSAFDALQSCTRLAVSIAEDESLHLPPRPLALPALECVEISSASTALIRPFDLSSFLAAAVLPVSRAVHVALLGIKLDGEPITLGDRFIVSQARCP
ncbi:hypothetical protein AURDEDRAFT_178563 [Auricularia subglabra TFB-10046 SS5]|uniref:F-box domain-containing protein n=1 Tax=Auricularia subglabra (strain TFB-10046 / SS5) TaxID=717982 RepID=J0D1A5_AURST|nr:hypothetical protein AURDEDRAFT_178563 [Auricularia subglabra TFB-10046 SS5]